MNMAIKSNKLKATPENIINFIFEKKIQNDIFKVIRVFDIVYFETVSFNIYQYLKNLLNKEVDEETGKILYKATPAFIDEVSKIKQFRKIYIISLAYFKCVSNPTVKEFRNYYWYYRLPNRQYNKKIDEVYQITEIIQKNVPYFMELSKKTLENQ